MNFSPLTFINAKSKRCILSSCLLRLCNSLFELAPRGFVPESECKSTATFPNYQTFCRLFQGTFCAEPHENTQNHTSTATYTQKKYKKKKIPGTQENNGKKWERKRQEGICAYADRQECVGLGFPKGKTAATIKKETEPAFRKNNKHYCRNNMRTLFKRNADFVYAPCNAPKTRPLQGFR